MSNDLIAQRIWGKTPEYTPNVFMEFRKSFQILPSINNSTIKISANQEYLLFINGQEIGRGPSPADFNWQYFDEYDVTKHLVTGNNVIAVLVYNFGNKDIVTNQFQGSGGLFAQLNANTVRDDVQIVTDTSWKCRRSPRWVAEVSRQHLWNGYREIYQAEKEDGWENCSYNDSDWEQAQGAFKTCGGAISWDQLLAREIPFLEFTKIRPETVFRVDHNYGCIDGEHHLLSASDQYMEIDASYPGSLPAVIYDFGREVVGYPELEIESPQGGVIQLYYGESLDLSLYDTFILKRGMNHLSPFGRRAFRYLQITTQATPELIKIMDFQFKFIHYPFENEGMFQTSDPLLNQIWDVGVYTTKVNSQDHLEDSVLREKALWVADGVVMGKVIYHVFGDHKLVRKCLLQSARIQNEDGSIPGTGPQHNHMMLPDFCAHWLFGVYTYWSYTQDESFLKEIWPNIVRLLDWFHQHTSEQGLFTTAGQSSWWSFIDWADYIDRRECVTALSCFYYKALVEATSLADAMKEERFKTEWSHRAVKLREAIRHRVWSKEKQAFVDCITAEGQSEMVTLQTNFAAIWSGIMKDDEVTSFIEHYYMNEQLPEIKGAFFFHIVLEVLFERQYEKKAMEIIKNYWGEMLDRGATTWWETFDPTSPSCTVPSPYQGNTPTYLQDHIPVSFCHGWGTSPSYLLMQHVLGINIYDLGKKKISFNPKQQLNLQWAKGEVPTPYGLIKASWHITNEGTLHYNVTLPKALEWSGQFPEDATIQVNGETIRSLPA